MYRASYERLWFVSTFSTPQSNSNLWTHQDISVQEFRINSILGLEFNCTVRDFLCPWHLLLIDLNVIRNCIQIPVLDRFWIQNREYRATMGWNLIGWEAPRDHRVMWASQPIRFHPIEALKPQPIRSYTEIDPEMSSNQISPPNWSWSVNYSSTPQLFNYSCSCDLRFHELPELLRKGPPWVLLWLTPRSQSEQNPWGSFFFGRISQNWLHELQKGLCGFCSGWLSGVNQSRTHRGPFFFGRIFQNWLHELHLNSLKSFMWW